MVNWKIKLTGTLTVLLIVLYICLEVPLIFFVSGLCIIVAATLAVYRFLRSLPLVSALALIGTALFLLGVYL
jgi:hypothetical protein